MMKNKKGQLVWDTLIPWIIAFFVLILAAIIYFTLTGKSNAAIDYLRAMLNLGN